MSLKPEAVGNNLWPIDIKSNGLFPPPGEGVGGAEFHKRLRVLLEEKLASGQEPPEICAEIKRFLEKWKDKGETNGKKEIA